VRDGYWRAESAEVIVRAWEQSGETLTAFARRHGLGRERLARWRTRLRKAPSPAGLRFHAVTVRKSPAAGVAPSGPETVAGGSGLELVVRGGRRIRVGCGFDPEVLVELVRVLESGRC
jgi:hypothetical protein